MKTIKTSSGMSPMTTILVGLAGTVVSVIVTMQLTKMLKEKGLPERKEDLKASLKKAGASAADLKASALKWIDRKSADAQDAATSATDKAVEVVDSVKEKVNG